MAGGFKVGGAGAGVPDNTGALLALLNQGQHSDPFAGIAASKAAAQELEQRRMELLLRKEENATDNARADASLKLDQARFSHTLEQDAVTAERQQRSDALEQEQLTLSQAREQRLADEARRKAEQDVAQEERASTNFAQQQAQQQFLALTASTLPSKVRTEWRRPALGSPLYSGFFGQPGAMQQDGTPSPRLREQLKNALVSNGHPADDTLEAKVDAMLYPRGFQVLEQQDYSELMEQAVALGIKPDDAHKYIETMAPPGLAFGPEDLQAKVREAGKEFGTFKPPSTEDLAGRALKLMEGRADLSKLAAGGGEILLNKETLGRLSLNDPALEAFAKEHKVDLGRLKTDELWRGPLAGAKFDAASGKVTLPANQEAARWQPVLDMLFQSNPAIAQDLAVQSAGQGVSMTPAQRDKLLPITPAPKIPGIRAAPDGGARAQSRMMAPDTSEQDFLKSFGLDMAEDFKDSFDAVTNPLGLPKGYTPTSPLK